ncbi:hypothetical protein SAMN05444274_105256 [Mariniphaga anaerophila]|uniref:Uncharacterized protein n=1 Tax=Mariniphaga anaerophila TaxID=1484053 RepID=A0A1M5BQ54_9BACT|nr:hypothetical protein SAMN05444274_105256 [Mariniphaga anaerophila]
MLLTANLLHQAKSEGECIQIVKKCYRFLTGQKPQTFAVSFAPNMLYNRSDPVGELSTKTGRKNSFSF